jgi:hypothetical protein
VLCQAIYANSYPVCQILCIIANVQQDGFGLAAELVLLWTHTLDKLTRVVFSSCGAAETHLTGSSKSMEQLHR